MEFSEKLRELRNEKGISQAKLAVDIHISRSAVAKWENGLGLPNDESLRLLAEYFGVSTESLLSNKDNEIVMVTKNRTIARQKKIIFSILIGILLGIVLFLCFHFEQMRESASLLGLGTILLILGAFNMRGNIGSIHWYNRRRVTKENQKPYCMLVGLGTLVIGICLIAAGIVQPLIGVEVGSFIMLAGVLIGLALIVYAQIKYNRGLF